MSFWEYTPETPALDNFDTLIGEKVPDFEKILPCPELIPAFRVKSPAVVKAFLDHQPALIKLIFTHGNPKVAKIGVELYCVFQSPLLKALISNSALAESVIQNVGSGDLVRVGFVSRIFQQALASLKDQTLAFFNSSLPSLALLTTQVQSAAVSDVLEAYLLATPFEGRWFAIALLRILAGASVPTPAIFSKFEGGIAQVTSQLGAVKLTLGHKCNLLKIIRTAITDIKLADVQASVIQAIPLIYKGHPEETAKILTLKLGTVLPRHKDVIKLAAEVAKRPLPWTELSVIGLRLLSVEPNKTYASLCAQLVEKFEADQNNSIFHCAFVKFVRVAVTVPELRQKFVDLIPPVVIKYAKVANWRKAARKVAFFMELALVLDPFLTAQTPEWVTFRETAVVKWQSRLEQADKEGVPLDGGPKIIDDGVPAIQEPSPQRKVEAPVKSADPPALADDSGFGSFPNFEASNPDDDRGFGSFPTFDEPKQQDDAGFDGFPAIEEVRQDDDAGFGSFPTFEEAPKEEDIGFSSFPAIEEPKKEADSGFGGFPTFEAQKQDQDSGFGGFSTSEESKAESTASPKANDGPGDEFGGFPAFPDPPKSAAADDSVFGSFPTFGGATEDDADPGFGGFRSFGEEAPKPEPPKPAPPPTPPPRPAGAEPLDLSFGHFMELINHSCWDYNGPSPAELFGQKDRFATVDEAFAFLVNQT